MPVRTRNVADVGDRLAAKLQWSRHAPARHEQFALTIPAVSHDRRELVRENPGERREVAGPVVAGAEQGADGGLAFGFRVQVAHVGHPLASILGRPLIVAGHDTQPHEPGRHVGRPRLREVRQVDAAG